MKIGNRPKKQNIKNPMLNSSVRFVPGTLNHGVHLITIFSFFVLKNLIKLIEYLNSVKNRTAVEIEMSSLETDFVSYKL